MHYGMWMTAMVGSMRNGGLSLKVTLKGTLLP